MASESTKSERKIPVKAALVVVCLVVLFLALRGGGDPFVGTWKLDVEGLGPALDRQMQARGMPSLGITPGKMPGFLTSTIGISNSRLELRRDSTYTMRFSMPIGERSQTGTWSAQADVIQLKPDQPGELVVSGRRDERTLLLTMDVGAPLGALEVPYVR